MKFFKKMSQAEEMNWKKAAIFGFYTYLILLFVNYTSSLISGTELIATPIVFWGGLVAAFGSQIILNVKLNKEHDEKIHGN